MKEEMVLMSKKRIERSIKRIACEISEKHSANERIILFGIEKTGFAVARRLADNLAPFFQEKVEAVQLPKENSDSIAKKFKTNKNGNSIVFIVDDVIFSGQTMFQALRNVAQNLHPSEMHTVVLVDRGHRKFPVEAQFLGTKLPTKLNEYVSVIIKEGQIIEILLKKFSISK